MKIKIDKKVRLNGVTWGKGGIKLFEEMVCGLWSTPK